MILILLMFSKNYSYFKNHIFSYNINFKSKFITEMHPPTIFKCHSQLIIKLLFLLYSFKFYLKCSNLRLNYDNFLIIFNGMTG